jgi:ectoine hydroxylase-related dioxygenase (phytanoyl-CoA dioxygenase family)
VVLPEFERLRSHDAVLGVLNAVYGGTARPGCGDTVRLFSPSSPELTTPPHQDGYYVRGRRDLWTAWIPLGACPRELGGLSVVPGSHGDGLRPHAGKGAGRQGVAAEPELAWECTDFECGDVLFFHALTLHRGLENRTDGRLRVSADFRYERASPRVG